MSKTTFKWDGEKIKQEFIQEEKKFTPKDIINSLAHVRNKIVQMNNSKAQLEQQSKTNEVDLKSAKKFEKKLAEFEKKCIDLQVEKLKLYIQQIHQECLDKATKSSIATVAKDPNAYVEGSQKKIGYLDYQKALATHPKVAKNISSQIITKYLYDEPVFDNPFLTTSKD